VVVKSSPGDSQKIFFQTKKSEKSTLAEIFDYKYNIDLTFDVPESYTTYLFILAATIKPILKGKIARQCSYE